MHHYASLKSATLGVNWDDVEAFFDNKLALLYLEFESGELSTEKLWELKGKAKAYRSFLRLKATAAKLYNQEEAKNG